MGYMPTVKVKHGIELPQQVVARNMSLKPKLVKQILLCALPSHHVASFVVIDNTGITRNML
jgi:hypothetical protein